MQANRASLFPELDAGFGPTRQRASAASAEHCSTRPCAEDVLARAVQRWRREVDLFGRVLHQHRCRRR
ncbi:hypothetical protein ACU4HD_44055 [Cupriavidus basilensis]